MLAARPVGSPPPNYYRDDERRENVYHRLLLHGFLKVNIFAACTTVCKNLRGSGVKLEVGKSSFIAFSTATCAGPVLIIPRLYLCVLVVNGDNSYFAKERLLLSLPWNIHAQICVRGHTTTHTQAHDVACRSYTKMNS